MNEISSTEYLEFSSRRDRCLLIVLSVSLYFFPFFGLFRHSSLFGIVLHKMNSKHKQRRGTLNETMRNE